MAGKINIVVKMLNGKSIKVTVNSEDKCEEIAKQVMSFAEVEMNSIRLIYVGKDIMETKDKKVGEIDIPDGSTMFLVLRLDGGARAM
jgi:hypothetical protein